LPAKGFSAVVLPAGRVPPKGFSAYGLAVGGLSLPYGLRANGLSPGASSPDALLAYGLLAKGLSPYGLRANGLSPGDLLA
jgi:hypothetical protein